MRTPVDARDLYDTPLSGNFVLVVELDDEMSFLMARADGSTIGQAIETLMQDMLGRTPVILLLVREHPSADQIMAIMESERSLVELPGVTMTYVIDIDHVDEGDVH